MNKNVLLTNIQNFMTSLQLTIGKLEALIETDRSYSLDQIDKQITLLQVRLQDDKNYSRLSNSSKLSQGLSETVKEKRNTLVRLINEILLQQNSLNQEKDKKNSSLSYEQREMEALANSLSMTDNDEMVIHRLNEKRDIIDQLKSEIDSITEEIKANDNDIEKYKEKISLIDAKEENNKSNLGDISNLVINENEKSKDIDRLNRFLSIKNFIVSVDKLNNIYISLGGLRDFLNNNRVNATLVATAIDKMQANYSLIMNQVIYFIKSINLEDINKDRAIINERVSSKNGYVLSDVEREMVYDEIASLQLDISITEFNIDFDDEVLSKYRSSIEKVENDISDKTEECKLLQKEVNDLELKRNYFFHEYTQSQNDDINKEIRQAQRKIDNISKVLKGYIKSKTDIENAIISIKKKKKSSEFIKEIKINDLNNLKESAFNKPTSKYSLNEDKQELVYLNFMLQLFDFANYLLSQNYMKRLEDLPLEVIEPFISVVEYYKYDNIEQLYSDEFIVGVKDTIEKMLNAEIIRPEDVIEQLKSQGFNVPKFGKSLKSMDKAKEVDKTVRLAA